MNLRNVEIKPTVCGICSAGCSINAHVCGGKVVRVEAPPGQRLCVKGLGMRGYLYRGDRILTPLKRTGPRGSGQFAPITWDEVLTEIAGRLNGYKEKYGADSVAFYTGYSKWYRPLLQRLAFSFGTLNYGTESSSCFKASLIASELTVGSLVRPDMANTELVIFWGANPFYNGAYSSDNLEKLREKGVRVLLIDPRVTPFSAYCDLQLRPKPGTDAALAHYFAARAIARGKIDRDYIRDHVHGFGPYAEYVKTFDSIYTAEVTGIPEKELKRAERMVLAAKRFAIAPSQTALTHHQNGVQNFRAVLALAGITGNIDREGGMIPVEYAEERRNHPRVLTQEFGLENLPADAGPKIGAGRFPVWSELSDEFQAMDLWRNIREGTPYPVRALFCLGLNARMFPSSSQVFEALRQVEFYVDTDLFMTDSAKYADILLPACSSFERSEFRVKPAGVSYVQPAIEPLGESRSDADILCELARRLDLPDDFLKGGYEKCCRYFLREVGPTLDDLKAASSNIPAKIPGAVPYRPGSNTRNGYRTPTGKFELYAEGIAKYLPEHPEYNPLPVFIPPEKNADYPLTLLAGGRLPYGFHARYNNHPWVKALRPGPMLDINPRDAERAGISREQPVTLSTPEGSLTAAANVTLSAPEGTVVMYHGYSEADVNDLLNEDRLDPYSGFPAYRSANCRISPAGEEA